MPSPNPQITPPSTMSQPRHQMPRADTAASTPADAAGRRLMIAVSDLAAHPGNVRDDLTLTEEFVASIASEGVRIPLLITTGPDGGWRVIEGHRRLAAAVQAGLAEVPCDLDPDRAGDEAGQYLDMLLANSDSYRANYTLLEETAALFAAHQAGASRTRIRKATGRTAAQVKTALAAGGLPGDTRARAAEASPDLTLEDLALLAEFDGDPEATDRLLSCLEYQYPLEHAAQRIRQDRAEAAEHARIRAELEAAGVPVTDSLPHGAAWLTSLSHDGQDLTPETHAACPGHGATFQAWNLLSPSYYCTSPAEHGHASRWTRPATGSDNDGGGEGSQPELRTDPEPAADPDRRLVIAGNRAWQAAADVRHRWLAASLFARRSVPREVHAFLARQLLAMPGPLRTGLAAARNLALFTTLTGRDAGQWDQDCDTAPAGRLALAALAPVVTAYEHAMTDAEGRNTWRTDRYSPCPRGDAGTYLAFLASLGYQLSDIEHAVADGQPWTGDAPQASTVTDPSLAADSSESQESDTSTGTTVPARDDSGTGSNDGDVVVQTAA